MELKIEKQLPQKVTWNYAELRDVLTSRMSMYQNLVYDDSQIGEAKKDKAELNKLKKALNDERIRQEKEFMTPFNEFKAQVKELCNLIDDGICNIDQQVKAYDQKKREAKLKELKVVYEMTDPKPSWLQYEQIHQDKWLNASATMVSAKKDMVEAIAHVEADLDTIKTVCGDFVFEATECYKKSLNIGLAINEAKRMMAIAEMKAEAERQKAAMANEPVSKPELAAERAVPSAPEAPEKRMITFHALITRQQAIELRDYFNRNHIEFTFERG